SLLLAGLGVAALRVAAFRVAALGVTALAAAAAAARAGAVGRPRVGIGAPLAARLLRGRGQHALGAAAGKELGEGLRILVLQPLRRLRRVGELPGDPRRRLVDAGFLDVLPAGAALPIRFRLFLR